MMTQLKAKIILVLHALDIIGFIPF